MARQDSLGGAFATMLSSTLSLKGILRSAPSLLLHSTPFLSMIHKFLQLARITDKSESNAKPVPQPETEENDPVDHCLPGVCLGLRAGG
jgi:hypothetical protein